MAICQFYLKGNCKFGNSCKFEHTGVSRESESTANSFGRYQTTATPKSSAEILKSDLTLERPIYKWSCYAFNNRGNVIEGTDLSPEEMKWAFMKEFKETGQIAAATKMANELHQKIEFEIKGIMGNAGWVLASSGPLVRPTSTSSFGKNSVSAFGSNTISAFGSAGQANTTAFGSAGQANTSAFGSACQANTSAFGSAGQANTSAFGSAGQANTSAFGSSQTTSSVFGQSAFGQPANSSTGAFTSNQTSFCSSGSSQSAFGKTGFGVASSVSAFGSNQQSAFGSVSNPDQKSSFGSTSAFQQSAFGKSSNTIQSNTFGSAAVPQQSAFGYASAASVPRQSAFGSATIPQQGTFGNTNTTQSSNISPIQQSAFGSTNLSQSSAFGSNKNPINSTNPPSLVSTNTPFSTFGQKAVQSNQNDMQSGLGTTGMGIIPAMPSSSNEQLSKNSYTAVNFSLLSVAMTREQVEEAFTSARFQFGLIPEVPPPK